VVGPEVPVNRRVLCGVAVSCYLITLRGMSGVAFCPNKHAFVAACPIRRVALDDCFRIPEYGFRNFPSRRIDFEIVGFPRICVFPHNAFRVVLFEE